jgi:hypothetical protein
VSSAQVSRCTWCVKYDLPCGDLTHDNVLARYVPLMESSNLSVGQITDAVPVVPGEPVVRQSHPAEHYERARRRADRISVVALVVLFLVAMIVILFLGLAATYFEPPASWGTTPSTTPSTIPTPTP